MQAEARPWITWTNRDIHLAESFKEFVVIFWTNTHTGVNHAECHRRFAAEIVFACSSRTEPASVNFKALFPKLSKI